MITVASTEVRWFFPGNAPEVVAAWFESIPGSPLHEARIDIYDLDAAHQGVGLKRRYPARTFDCKMLVASREELDLGFGVSGDLEEWIKMSQPLRDELDGPGSIEISKITQAKRTYLDNSSGCEAELAEISMGSIKAWTLCLETFGEPGVRHLAMDHGLEFAFGSSPPPTGVAFSSAASASYPEWISVMHSGSPVLPRSSESQAVSDVPTPEGS